MARELNYTTICCVSLRLVHKDRQDTASCVRFNLAKGEADAMPTAKKGGGGKKKGGAKKGAKKSSSKKK